MTAVKLVRFTTPLRDRLAILASSAFRPHAALSRLAEDINILRKPDGLVYVGSHEDMSMFNHYLLSAHMYVTALAKGSMNTEDEEQAIRYLTLAALRAAKIEVHGMPTGSINEWEEVETVAGARYQRVTMSVVYNSRKSPFGRWMEVNRVESLTSHGAIEVWTAMDPAEIYS